MKGGENTTENNKTNPMETLLIRLKDNRKAISVIPDANYAARTAIKEINEALIEFFESL